MKRTEISPVGSDYCALYEVTDFKASTVREFVKEVLTSFPREHGTFKIDHDDLFPTFRYYEYADGKMKTALHPLVADLEVDSVKSYGGWSLMDYIIKIKTAKK